MALDDALHLLLNLLGHDTLLNALEKLRLALQVLPEVLLPRDNVLNRDVVEKTVDTGVDDGDLDLGREGLVLTLLEELCQSGTTLEGVTGTSVKIGAELRDCL